MLNGIKRILSGVAAGVLVSIGGCVYLACENKIVGAVLFSVALLSICYKGYSLYTGRVGYLAFSRTKKDLSVLFLGLFGNLLGAVFTALLVHLSGLVKVFSANAETVAAAKLGQPFYGTLIRAFLCGILMYLAVSIYKEHKTPVGILFCIPVFILSGFEHSIADMFYLSAGIASDIPGSLGPAALFTLAAVLGNSLGALFIAFIERAGKEKAAS